MVPGRRHHVLHVFILDDNPGDIELLGEALRIQAVQWSGSSDPSEALRMLSAADPLPDVVVVDHFMPVIDGPTWIAAARLVPRLRDLCYVGLRGIERPEFDAALLRAGVRLVLSKPSHFEEVMENARRIIQMASRADTGQAR